MSAFTGQRLRLRYRKDEVLMWVSHLDLLRLMLRLCRRAGIPLAMSGSQYSPKPKLSFGPALPVGVAAYNELLDLSLREDTLWDAGMVEQAAAALAHAALPRDFVGGLVLLPPDDPGISKLATGGRYQLQFATEQAAAQAVELIHGGTLLGQDKRGNSIAAAQGLQRSEQQGTALELDGTVNSTGSFNVMRLARALESAGCTAETRLRRCMLDAAGAEL